MKKTHLIFTVLAVAVSLGSFQSKAAAAQEAQEEADLTATLRARLDRFRPACPEKEKKQRKAFSVVRELMSRGDSPSEKEIILRAYLQLERGDKIFLNYLIKETPLHAKLISILQKEKEKWIAKRKIALGDAQKKRVQEAACIEEEKRMREKIVREMQEERMRRQAERTRRQAAGEEDPDAGLYEL